MGTGHLTRAIVIVPWLFPRDRTCILTLCILPLHASICVLADDRGSAGRPESRGEGAGDRDARVERDRGIEGGGASDAEMLGVDALPGSPLRVDGGGLVGVD